MEFHLQIYWNFVGNNLEFLLQKNIQEKKLSYIAEDCSVDKGYWLYIIVDQNIIKTQPEIARKSLIDILNFLGVESF